MANLQNGDEIDLIKFGSDFYYIDGKGAYVLFQTGSGEPTWSQVLSSGSTSSGVSPTISSGDTLKFVNGETSSITAATQTAARTWTLPDKTGSFAIDPTLAEVLSNGNITDGTNIELSTTNVITTAVTATGSTISLNYGGSGKDILISTDAGGEAEAGIYISDNQGNYGITKFVDGYTASSTIEKTSAYSLGRGFSSVTVLSPNMHVGYYDRATDVAASTTGGLGVPYGIVSIGDVNSTVTFSSSNIGVGKFHSGTTTINSGVDRSAAIGGTGYTVKTSDAAYSTQFAIANASYETLLTIGGVRTQDTQITFGDRNLDFTTAQTYTPTNVSTDRSFDADTVLVAELADVVGTLIADLQSIGILS